jgi:hypothetical protein
MFRLTLALPKQMTQVLDLRQRSYSGSADPTLPGSDPFERAQRKRLIRGKGGDVKIPWEQPWIC